MNRPWWHYDFWKIPEHMTMKLKPLLAVAALSTFGAPSAFAAEGPSAWRCRNDLVQLGESKGSASQKCGEPVFKDAFCKPQAVNPASSGVVVPSSACEQVEEWTYKPGYGQFITTLRFESGRLVSISYGDRSN